MQTTYNDHLTQDEKLISMNKIFSWFVGWIGGLFAYANTPAFAHVPVPLLDWVPSWLIALPHLRDIILLLISAVKGGFLAVTSWLFLLGARSIRKKILRWMNNRKNRKK